MSYQAESSPTNDSYNRTSLYWANNSLYRQPDFKQLAEYKVSVWLQLYSPPVLITLGTLGDLACLIVLLKSGLAKQHATLHYLATYTAFSLISLWLSCGAAWITQLASLPAPEHRADWLCRLWPVVYNVSRFSTGWLLMATLIETALSLCRPQTAKYYCSLFGAKFFTFLIPVCIGVISVHSLWSKELMSKKQPNGGEIYGCEPIPEAHFFLTHVWTFYISFFIFSCVPLVGILIALICVIRSMYCTTDMNMEGSQNPMKILQRQTTKTAVTFSTAFLLLTSPETTLGVVGMISMLGQGAEHSYPTMHEYARQVLVLEIFRLLTHVCYCLSFPLVYFSMELFREQARSKCNNNTESALLLTELAKQQTNGTRVTIEIEVASTDGVEQAGATESTALGPAKST